MLVEDQPDFLNAVVMFETEESIEEILAMTQAIEQQHKKSIKYRYGPRTLDIDILLYGREIIRTNNMIIPHPRLTERRFVLEPLVEVGMGSMVVPGTRHTVDEFLTNVRDQDCRKIEQFRV